MDWQDLYIPTFIEQYVSQGSLQEGKRTAGLEGWVRLTPRTGRMV